MLDTVNFFFRSLEKWPGARLLEPYFGETFYRRRVSIDRARELFGLEWPFSISHGYRAGYFTVSLEFSFFTVCKIEQQSPTGPEPYKVRNPYNPDFLDRVVRTFHEALGLRMQWPEITNCTRLDFCVDFRTELHDYRLFMPRKFLSRRVYQEFPQNGGCVFAFGNGYGLKSYYLRVYSNKFKGEQFVYDFGKTRVEFECKRPLIREFLKTGGIPWKKFDEVAKKEAEHALNLSQKYGNVIEDFLDELYLDDEGVIDVQRQKSHYFHFIAEMLKVTQVLRPHEVKVQSMDAAISATRKLKEQNKERPYEGKLPRNLIALMICKFLEGSKGWGWKELTSVFNSDTIANARQFNPEGFKDSIDYNKVLQNDVERAWKTGMDKVRGAIGLYSVPQAES